MFGDFRQFSITGPILDRIAWWKLLIEIHSKISVEQDPYSPTILKNSFCRFLQDFFNLNLTQLLIG